MAKQHAVEILLTGTAAIDYKKTEETAQRKLRETHLKKIIAAKATIQLILDADITQHLFSCHELQGINPNLVDEFLNAIFLHKPHQKTMLEFLNHKKNMPSLKYKIVLLWMKSSEQIKGLKKEQLWLFFDILRKKEYLPEKFMPGDAGCAEVVLCNWVLEELKKDSSDPRSLSYLAYATFLLAGVLKVPEANLSMDMMPAIKQFTQIAAKTGACTKDGLFYTKKMPINEMFSKMMTHPEVTKSPNFMKALSLIQYANFTILPIVLKSIEDKISLKGFETELKQYYSHLSRIFIPNLLYNLNILRRQDPNQSFAALNQISKFIMEFPVDLFVHVEIFIHTLTRSCLKNLDTAPLKETLEIIKLNTYVEIKYQTQFLFEHEKAILLAWALKQKDSFDATEIEMLMHTQYTLFEPLQDRFSIFEPQFKDLTVKKAAAFANKSQVFYYETEFYKCIVDKLSKNNKVCLRQNHICRKTGKEIDIAYISGDLKIAIHIEGRRFHYYLDREERNRTTLLRNHALQNAGWINICQVVPDQFKKSEMETYKKDLLDKIKLFLPLNGGSLTQSTDAHALVEMTKNAFKKEINSEQIGKCLSLNQIDIMEGVVNCGLKNRFNKVRQEMDLIKDVFKNGVSIIVSQYDLPHPFSEEFAAISNAPKVVALCLKKFIFPYTQLLFMKEFMSLPERTALAAPDQGEDNKKKVLRKK